MTMNVRLFRTVSALTLLLTLCVPARATVFQVEGQGTLQGGLIGVIGELITFSFSYDDALFGPPASVGGGIGAEYAVPPITVSVQGAVSGALIVDPIDRVSAFDTSFDQWNFESGINGLAQANAFGADPFGGLFPASAFVDVNNIFVPALAAGVFASSSNVSFGLDHLSPGNTLSIGSAMFTVSTSTVPVPATLVLVALGGIGLGWRRRG